MWFYNNWKWEITSFIMSSIEIICYANIPVQRGIFRWSFFQYIVHLFVETKT